MELTPIDPGSLSPEVDAAVLAAAGDLPALAMVVADAIGDAAGTAVILGLLDTDGERLRVDAAVVGGVPLPALPPESPRLDGELLGPALREGRTRYVTMPPEEMIQRCIPGLRPFLAELQPTVMLLVPLVVRGRSVGALTVLRGARGRPFDEREQTLVEALARRVALPAEHARLLAATAHHGALEAGLARIGERALAEESIDALLTMVVEELRDVLQADTAGVLEAEADGVSGRVRAAIGLGLGPGDPLDLPPAARARLAAGTSGTWEVHFDGGEHQVSPAGPGVVCAITVLLRPEGHAPLFVGAGRCTNRPFGGDERRFVASVAQLLLAAIGLRSTQARLRAQALTDALTGLPNRRSLTERLSGHAGDAAPLALLLTDLDDFKVVNDSMGHAEGDVLLRTVAARLAAVVRPSDLVARLGGDEFAVLCPGVDERGAVAVAERMLAALAEPVGVSGRTLIPRASIGVAILEPGDGTTIDSLFARADLAMYRAKRDGGGRVAVYDVLLHERVERRAGIEHGLRAALRTGEGLSTVYQPVVGLDDGEVWGMETLVRWRHPALGALAPDEFVPLAEESSLVCDLDLWVLGAAARQARAWADDGLLGGGRRVGVNLSTRHFEQPGVADRLAAVLDDAGCPPALMLVEITETLLTDGLGPEAVRRILDLGCEVAVDDFGTGYSSLAQLKRVPVDFVKIDRSFVAGLLDDPVDATIVRSTLTLGRALGRKVVAEGIETVGQLRALIEMGCVTGQGYLLGRPADAATATRWLRDGLDVSVPALLGQSRE